MVATCPTHPSEPNPRLSIGPRRLFPSSPELPTSRGLPSSLTKASSDAVRVKRQVSEGGLLDSLDPSLPETPRNPVATVPNRVRRAMLVASSPATMDTEPGAAQSTVVLGFLRNRAAEVVSWAAKLEPVGTRPKLFISLQGWKESGQTSPLATRGTLPGMQLEMEHHHDRGPDRSVFPADCSSVKGDDESVTGANERDASAPLLRSVASFARL